jgi:hypothetical protein
MADDFTKTKFAWLLQIASDPDLSRSTCKLAILIACRFLNRKTQTAWPSQLVLAELLGIRTREGVRYCVNQLVDRGHLAVEVSHGRGTPNRYRIILKDAAQNEPDEDEATQPDDDPAEAAPPKTAESGELFADTEETAPKPAPRAKPKDLTADFEAWWLQYPRKVSKGSASKAYDKARKSGATAAELEIGALRYSASRTNEDPKFTKHASTWLNNECWRDEPEPARGNFGIGTSSRSQQPRRSYIDIALKGLRRDEQE